MARFVHVKIPGCAIVAGLVMLNCLPEVRAEGPASGQVPPAPAAKTPPPAANAAANAPKVKLPFPGAGEVKVPSPDELAMRTKLESLAQLTDDEIRAQLEQWPVYTKMSLRDQGLMLQRIQDFRDYRTRSAAQAARDLGVTLTTPDQKAKFEKVYWDKRLKMDEDLARQFGPIFNSRQKKMNDELVREFAVATAPVIAQGPKPPAPTPPANKPAPAPAAQKPTGGTVAQAPH